MRVFLRTECFSARYTACFPVSPQYADRQTVRRRRNIFITLFILRKRLFHDAEKPVPQCYKASSGRRNGLSGTPETSRRHDGGVFMACLNAFSCPVIMFPQHRGMAFTGMCFNLKLLIVWMVVLQRWSGTDSEETCRTLLARLSGRCGT